ncbi:MAG: hypothetical protein M3T56_08530 [Chloroflexota bacterium]|nr:hypothetical protein [Chloroflexota bacterium]
MDISSVTTQPDYRCAVYAAYELFATATDPAEAAELLQACRGPLQERVTQLFPQLQSVRLFPLLDSLDQEAADTGQPRSGNVIFDGVWASMADWQLDLLRGGLHRDPSMGSWRERCEDNINVMRSLIEIEERPQRD